MEKKDVIKIIRKVLIVLIIAWMIMVFIFSQQTGEGSGGLSFKISQMIFRNEDVAKSVEPVIRKLAHMGEFALGSILIYSYCLTFPKMEAKKQILFTQLSTMLYAVTDEMHQLFIPGRHGSIVDILIDSVGALLGIGILWFTHRLIMGLEYKAKEDIERNKNIR